MHRFRASPFKIGRVAGDDGQVMHQRDGGDLLVDRMPRISGHQLAPHFGAFAVEVENAVYVLFSDGAESTLERAGLLRIAARADALNSPAQCADGLHRQMDVLFTGRPKKRAHARVGLGTFARITDDIGVDQKHE